MKMDKAQLQTRITILNNKQRFIPTMEKQHFENSMELIQDQLDYGKKLLVESNLNIVENIVEEIIRLENSPLERISKKEFLAEIAGNNNDSQRELFKEKMKNDLKKLDIEIAAEKKLELDENFIDNLLLSEEKQEKQEKVMIPIERKQEKLKTEKTSRIKHKSIMERLLESKPTWT